MKNYEDLKGKKILLLAPDFFGYYDRIANCLKKKGAEVEIILEGFVNQSPLYRFFWIKNRFTKYLYTNRYYTREISKLGGSFDCILVIRGEAISAKILQLLKDKYPESKFILYQWDSVKNNPNAVIIKDYFDLVFTFDMDDAKTMGWRYRPLFYTAEKKTDLEKEIDFTFIGTLYYKRAALYRKIKELCNNKGYSLFDHLYSPRIVFWIHKYILKDNRYSTIENNEIKHFAISQEELINIYNKTAILVDYSADDQSGLTIRTIESLIHKCKIITNNHKIKESDIYQMGNIYIYDLDAFNIPEWFIRQKYNEPDDELLYKYSLNGWIEDIIK